MGNAKTTDSKSTPTVAVANKGPTLVTADLHISPNRRDAYRYILLEKTLPRLVKEHSVARIIICGDLTEAKTGHSAELVNRLVDAFAALAERASIYLLKGNHDYLNEDVPFFRHMRHLPRVQWINEPTEFRLRGLGDCLFLPFSRAPEEEWKPLLTQPRDWYFCHQAFDGAVGENDHRIRGASRSIFPRGARVISGDVHVPQRIGYVTYTGAPYIINFGDAYDPRVLLLNGREIHSVPVPGPQKRLIVLRSRDEKYPNVAPGDVVKIRVEPPAGNQTPHVEWRTQARKWAEAAGVELYTTEIVAPRAAPSKLAERGRASDVDLVRAYAKKMRVGKTCETAGLKLMENTDAS